MRIMKSWKAVLSLGLLLVISCFNVQANVPIDKKDPTTVRTQITKYLQNIDLKKYDQEKTVMVDFMITATSEILVLSTNDEEMDNVIKIKLNYKKISAPELERGKTYTLPLVFRQK